ncbi:hypothetical protein Hamer_G017545 [Homarus americanus]|uniref:Uncharacterized protein n=1 Tax=Homarus americanus TaxID=6706 RepID=A0A8J5JEV1_HOMAM|nr:hypothetical protein Hamer_G017545 [Homarus americanus]
MKEGRGIGGRIIFK